MKTIHMIIGIPGSGKTTFVKKDNIFSNVINVRFLKPFDEKTLLTHLSKLIITIEDGTIVGGLGSKVEEILKENEIPSKLIKFAYPDEFIKHGSVAEIEEKYGLDAESISERIKQQLKRSKITNIC